MNAIIRRAGFGDAFAAYPAVRSYLRALDHLTAGTVGTRVLRPGEMVEPGELRVAIPLPEGDLLVEVDERAARNSGFPPAFWRKPTVVSMMAAMKENFVAGARLHEWPGAVRTTWNLVTIHPTRSMSIGEVATCLDLSAGYLGSRVEQILGSTFRHLLRDERVAVACRQLLETDLRISEIAAQLGGQSLSQFNRNFSAATGMNPRAYRLNFGGAEVREID